MKKVLYLLLIILTGTIFVGCGKKEDIKLLTPNGTPFISVGNLINEKGLTIDNVDGSEPLINELSSNTYDIILAPITAGTKLYIKDISKYKLDSIVTINNTYIVSRKTTTLNSISDLEGKSILAYGQNNTPDIALKEALGDVQATITYTDSVQTAVTTFVGNTQDPSNPPANTPEYILIAEPSLTQVQERFKMELNILDLSQEMNTNIYQAGIFINPESDQKRVGKIIEKIEENIKYLNEKPEEYAKSIVSKNRVFETLTENIIAKSIPKSNINYEKAKTAKEKLETFFKMINTYNPQIIGGVPNEDFYN